VQRADLKRTAIGLLIAAAVFAVLLYFVDAGEVFEAITRADPLLIGLAALLMLLWNVSWGVALWNVLETQNAEVSLPKAVLFHAAAAFANHVTPLGQAGGEPITAWLITRSTDTDYEVSLASVASFDALHVIPSLSFAALGAVYLLSTTTIGDSGLGYLPVAIIALALVVPVVAYLVWQNRRRIAGRVRTVANRAVRGIARVLPGVATPDIASVEKGLLGFAHAVERVATNRRRLALAVGFSGLGWVFQACGMLVVFHALAAPIPVYVPLIVIPIAATGGGLPTPGGLGGTEAVSITLLALLTGVAAPTITAAVALHSTGGYLLTTGVGAAATSFLGVREYA
jgi:hypothetical protein